MVGKRYSRKVTKNVIWIVEVVSESLTHVYIKVLNPSSSNHKWNVSKKWFSEHYKEVEVSE